MPSFLYVLEELCASLRIVGKRESKDPELQKEYLKLVDEEPTAVIPDEIESVVKENVRGDLEIVALFQNIDGNHLGDVVD